MSLNPSTAPAVKAKLLELFKAATDLELTEVWSARTNEEHQAAENIYLGRVRGGVDRGHLVQVFNVSADGYRDSLVAPDVRELLA